MRLLIFLFLAPLIVNAENQETEKNHEIVEALQECQASFFSLWDQLADSIKSYNVVADQNTTQYATIRKLRRKIRKLKRRNQDG